MPARPTVLELAEAAYSCVPLTRARRLAEWVGPRRTLTDRGVLRPVDATQACRDLSIELSSPRLRSALDSDELMQDWVTAVAAGFIVIDGTRARGVDLDEIGTPASDPEGILDAWVATASFLLDLADDEDPCAGCLTALHVLNSAGEPVAVEQLVSTVAAIVAPQEPEDMPCPGCGQIHRSEDELDPFDDISGDEDWLGEEDWDEEEEEEEDPAEHVAAMLTGLLAFKAAEVTDAKIQLTPLGGLLAERVFQELLVPANADASALVSAIMDLPPPLADLLARPWLAARPGPAAADELLTFAESADGLPRVAALAFAGQLGIEAADAYRKRASRPGFGAYARLWLLEHHEPVQEDPADQAWLATDGLYVLVESLAAELSPEEVHDALAAQLGEQLAEAADLLRGSGHPKAEFVAASISAAHERGWSQLRA